MNDKKLNDLDDLLQHRFVPKPSNNLARRIINESNKKKSINLYSNFFRKFIINIIKPKPAIAFASVIMIVFFVFTPMLQKSSTDADILTTQDYFASVMDYDFILDELDKEQLL